MVNPGTSAKASQVAPEYEIKASYLLLFTRYVTWPAESFASSDSPLVVGVVGRDPFGKVIDESLRHAAVGKHRLEIRRIPDVDGVAGCHMVFLAETDLPKLSEVLQVLRGKPVLTVTEAKLAMEFGSVVNFVMEGNRLRFEVSLVAAEKAGLKIATPMLVSAKKVLKDPAVEKED